MHPRQEANSNTTHSAERFGVPLQMTEEEKRALRAKRFGVRGHSFRTISFMKSLHCKFGDGWCIYLIDPRLFHARSKFSVVRSHSARGIACLRLWLARLIYQLVSYLYM